MDTTACPHCNRTLFTAEISTNNDCYLICVHCKLVFVDEIVDPGIYPASFKGKTSRKDTAEYYENEIIFLTAYIGHLGDAIHKNLSQWACHHNASLSLILRSYLAESKERLHRMQTKGRERP